ncbi:hypothetical protein GCK72_010997 [Caenorhabditis remanei]|uniref:RING-type domain-containing protein n=1 Tax=Caenorhabditis remanei TaxID=31234 RepID=A0A6A5H6L4_CAERE|nr:hypothetical protein GCK72_010997 [Caenorhabditis remanei]KAF1762735.1 hypothetical protein GCK72_010997 [Caenorhabditis remanei]
MVDMPINPTQESESTEDRFEKKREAAEHRRLMLQHLKMIKKGKGSVRIGKPDDKVFRQFFEEVKSISSDRTKSDRVFESMSRATDRFYEETGIQKDNATAVLRFFGLNVVDAEVREKSINNPTVRKMATATRRHVHNCAEKEQVTSLSELRNVLDKMVPGSLNKEFSKKEQEILENIIKDGGLFVKKGRGDLEGKVVGFTDEDILNMPLKDLPVSECLSLAQEKVEKWMEKLRTAPKRTEITTRKPETPEKPIAVYEEEPEAPGFEEVTVPAQTKKEHTAKKTEESFRKAMKDASDKGSILMPVLQEIVRKRRESAEKTKTSESEPKEEEVKTKKKKTENLEKDTTDYKKKFLNASKHCREAQEEMKLAVNKAERFEKKAKRTDELERKMKEMEKEMQRMNRKLVAQAQQAEEIERLKAKISKKETVEKQLRAEKKDLIHKNQSLQLELYKLKASSPNSSAPLARVVLHNLDELQNMKDDFPRDELLNEMREMAEKVQTISNSSENVKVAEYELIRMEKTINIYLDTLEINIQKIKKTHDNSELFPLPRVPCFSEKFLRIYFDEIDKLPSDAQGIPDTDCLICHVFRESDEKTIQCATCNKVYHLDCAQQWFKTKRTCPHCCEWFKQTKESMVNNNINNCWKL